MSVDNAIKMLEALPLHSQTALVEASLLAAPAFKYAKSTTQSDAFKQYAKAKTAKPKQDAGMPNQEPANVLQNSNSSAHKTDAQYLVPVQHAVSIQVPVEFDINANTGGLIAMMDKMAADVTAQYVLTFVSVFCSFSSR